MRFRESYAEAPASVQRAFDKKSLLLIQKLRHPSLHAKKYSETDDIWQARVSRDWRFYFQIRGDAYYLVNITHHPK